MWIGFFIILGIAFIVVWAIHMAIWTLGVAAWWYAKPRIANPPRNMVGNFVVSRLPSFHSLLH